MVIRGKANDKDSFFSTSHPCQFILELLNELAGTDFQEVIIRSHLLDCFAVKLTLELNGCVIPLLNTPIFGNVFHAAIEMTQSFDLLVYRLLGDFRICLLQF